MPEINPLSNNQIFLKKIAENTGSDYDTGDVSEINPLTIDQIFLKEIAANTAGQSGDISELKGKVADNTAAISAMVNVNGACNALPIDLASSDIIDGVTFTVTSDGIVVSGTATADIDYPLHSNSPVLNKNVNYKLTGCPTGGSSDTYYLQVGLWNSSTFIDGYRDYGNGNSFNSENNTGISGDIIIKSGTAITTPIIFKPMLYDARLKPTGYVPYAMTNRELTERIESLSAKVNRGHVSVEADGVKTYKQLLQDLYAAADTTKVSLDAKLLYYTGALELYRLAEFSVNNSYFTFQRPGSANAYGEIVNTMQIGESNRAYRGVAYGGVEHDRSSEVPVQGQSFTLYY